MQSFGQLAAQIADRHNRGSSRAVPSYSPPPRGNSGVDYGPFPDPSGSAQSSGAGPFGPLPSDMGTPAQRQFWASRCQNIPNDGGSAAQGCNQTLLSLGINPSSRPAPVSSGRNAGGLASSSSEPSDYASTKSDRGHRAELLANQCVRTEFKSDGQVFTNGCSATIGMAWCHEGSNCPGDNPGKGQLSIELKPGEHYTSWGNVGLQLRFGACRRPSGYVTVKLAAGNHVQCITNN